MDMRLRNIDRFQVREVLGEGGQGTVYLAHDPRLHRDVAIKTLRAGKAEDAQALLQEARAVSRLRHPCIVPVFEAGQIGDMHYLVFEFVTGDTLQDLIARKGALPVEHARRIAGQVLGALAHAHQNGVLHRDIKSANIMLGSDGEPRIMDFGAATRTHLNWLNGSNVAVDDDFIGTPAYMAPEYIEKREFSAKTDVYAAGLVCFEMFTGQRVFRSEGGNLDMLFRKIVLDPVVLPPAGGIDERIMSCLLRAMARDPMQRFDSVVEMKAALLGCDGEGEGSSAEGGSTLEFLLRRMRLKKEFPALSESVTTVNQIIFSENGSIASLTNAVLKDFSLTGKIIKLANSAYYNPGRRVDIATISAAVYRLGFDTIRNIVLGLLLFDQIKDREQKHDLMGECVKAVLGGAIAKEICVSQGYGNPEETFICSMMHNLGRMLSQYYFPEESREIRTLVDLGKQDENQASRQVLGASYTELGQGVARTWGFPDQIIASMDKRPPPHPGRGTVGSEEKLRLISCMAAELAESIVGGDPEQRREQAGQVLNKFKGHFKLNGSGLDQVLARSLDKVEDYAKAVGWNLDAGMARKLAVSVSADAADVTQRPDAEGALEQTLQISTAALDVTRGRTGTDNALPRCEILSGGIQDITHALVDGRSLSDILRIIIETIYAGIGFEHAIFALNDQKRGVMVGRFGLGAGVEPLVGRFRFPVAYAPDAFHISLQKNIDILFNDTRDPKIAPRIPAWYREAFDIGSFMLFPVVVKDKPVGMIYAGSRQPNSIVVQEAELKLLRTLRNQAVLAVRQAA